MQKLLFASIITCCMMVSSHTFGQSIYYQVSASLTGSYTHIQTTNIAITTSQTISPGVVNSWTNRSPGGYFTNPIGLFTYGAYWITPTLFNPVTISVNPGYTADVQNFVAVPLRVHISLRFYTGESVNTIFDGPEMTIPGNSIATLSIPAGGYTYTSTPAGPGGLPTPVPLFMWVVER
jgi:hypothetical protein